MPAPLTVTVSPDEYRMLIILRDMPESPLRDRIHRLLGELLELARNPRCSQFQADGVPCGDSGTDCDQCQVVRGMLDRLGHS
jgi:hypothetical protein